MVATQRRSWVGRVSPIPAQRGHIGNTGAARVSRACHTQGGGWLTTQLGHNGTEVGFFCTTRPHKPKQTHLDLSGTLAVPG